jgi:hypothetical protein
VASLRSKLDIFPYSRSLHALKNYLGAFGLSRAEASSMLDLSLSLRPKQTGGGAKTMLDGLAVLDV